MSELSDKLTKLGLRLSLDALNALLAHAQKSRLSAVQVLEQICLIEQRERDAKNLARRSKFSALGTCMPIDKFDWNHPRSIDRQLYEGLLNLDFLARGENVLMRGQAGVGKTSLAQNLGMRALERGYTVRFSTVPAALVDLIKQESLPAMERRLKRYTTPDLLILDELGYVPCDSRAADAFFNIVTRRHEKRSVVITTNLAYKHWGSVFHDASCLGALVDRFAQHCHTLDIDADSWRNRLAQQRLETNKKSGAKT
jgi:DNA replication protein DnaC